MAAHAAAGLVRYFLSATLASLQLTTPPLRGTPPVEGNKTSIPIR